MEGEQLTFTQHAQRAGKSMRLTTEQRFWEFHEANPHVYLELVRLARRAKDHGKKRIGVKMIWEVMRWNLTIETHGDPEFKLNNKTTGESEHAVTLWVDCETYLPVKRVEIYEATGGFGFNAEFTETYTIKLNEKIAPKEFDFPEKK